MKLFCSVKSKTNNEQGMALIIVLLIMTLFMVLGMSLIGVSINNVKSSAYERDHESVYYIAEAGAAKAFMQAEQAVIHVKKTIESPYKSDFYAAVDAKILSPAVPYPAPNFDEAFGKKPSAAISVIKEAEGTYNITSVGTIGGQTRTAKRTFLVNWQPPVDFAVFSKKIELSGVVLNGNIGVSSKEPGSVSLTGSTKFNEGTINPDACSIYTPKGAQEPTVSWGTYPHRPKVCPYDGEVPIAMPPFPIIPSDYKQPKAKLEVGNSSTGTLDMTENLKFTDIIVSQKGVLTINVGDSDKAIVTDNLTLTGGTIHIVGSGKLTLYIRKKIDMSSSAKINYNQNSQPDSEKLMMYLDESTEALNVSIAGGNKVHGSLYAKTANLSLGGNGVFEGHVYAGGTKVDIAGSAEVGSDLLPSLFYAPNATVTLSNGADITGLLVANLFKGEGGSAKMSLVPYSRLPLPVPIARPFVKEGLMTKKPVRES